MNRNLFRINNGILTIASGNEEVANFDFEGRILFYTKNGVMHRRSSDNSLFKLGWDNDVRSVTPLEKDEASAIYDRCYQLARNFPADTLSDEEKAILEKISTRNPEWLEQDAAAITSLYAIKPIMPPDQASAVYLELSSGTKWNRCTISSSYAGRTVETKDSAQFMEHVEKVKNQLGEGLKAKKGIFLGDPGALDVDQKELLPILDKLKADFGLPLFSAFDMFSTPKRKNMIHYMDIKNHGLDRIFVFIQSGSYKVIKLFNDKINVNETLNLINNLKDHGISVSLVILAGMGGKKYDSDHVEGTANVISQMMLENGDMIFLSPIVEEDDPEYQKIVERESIGSMSPEEKVQQMDRLTKAIKESYLDMNGKDLAIPIIKYDLREAFF
jgi:hypothetical protein